MHEDACGRIETIGGQIEPGLTVQKAAHLDEPHRVVGIEECAFVPDIERAGIRKDKAEAERDRDQEPQRRGRLLWLAGASHAIFCSEAPSVRFVKSEPFAQNAIRRACRAYAPRASVLEQKL